MSRKTELEIRGLADSAGRDAGEFAAEVLAAFVEQDAAMRAGVVEGIGQAERGELLEEDAMDARVKSWFVK